MSNLQQQSPKPLPTWLIGLGSLFAVGHLLAIGLYALAASSGPWPVPPPIGASDALGPHFASNISSRVTHPYYLWPLRMTHNYHFQTNQVSVPGVAFEIKLKDEKGEVFKTFKFPDEHANFWVRQREALLARKLFDDQPVEQRGSVKIGPQGEKTLIEHWSKGESDMLQLTKSLPTDESLRPDAMRPSELSKILSQAFMRHACRQHGANWVELVRYSQPPITPMFLLMPNPPTEESLTVFKSHFGEYRREK
jgi:hypothetical protein